MDFLMVAQSGQQLAVQWVVSMELTKESVMVVSMELTKESVMVVLMVKS